MSRAADKPMRPRTEGRPRPQSLKATESRLKLVTDALPVLIAYCDTGLVYRFCNARYTEWFGLAREDVVGKPLAAVLGEAAYRAIEPFVRRVLQGERVIFEQALPYQHGPKREVRVEYLPHYEGGVVVGFYGMIQDMGARLEAERERARLAALVEHTHDAILAKDLDGVITDWNAAAQRMYGYSREEVVGRNVRALAPEDRQDEVSDILARVRQGEATANLQTVRVRKDGHRLDVILTVSPIRDGGGEVVGASAIAHDISRRLAAERKLKELADRLEERVAERTAMADRRAIDLRDMASQVTQAEQRARKRLAQVIHDDLQQLLVAAKLRVSAGEAPTSADDLARVSELLDKALGRCRSLVSELRPPVLQDGSLNDALAWLARQVREHHGLEVEPDYQEPAPDMDVEAKTVLFEVCRELLFNVVKHAGTHRATLRTRHEGAMLTLELSDAGRGFDPAQVRESRGDGFGLFSVRERIVAFGGEVDIDSGPGNGSRFTLRFPLRTKARSQKPPRRSPPPGSGRPRFSSGTVRILVADDHGIFREGLVRILSAEAGFEVVGQAADGIEAAELALELEPDVVVMDISMPQVNGIEATRNILAELPDTKVIGLSLHDAQDMGHVFRRAGAAAYLQKEEASTRLIAAIRAAIGTVERHGAKEGKQAP